MLLVESSVCDLWVLYMLQEPYQGKHDQVCIQAIQAVALIGYVVGEPLLMPDVLHDLMFTFARNVMPCTPC